MNIFNKKNNKKWLLFTASGFVPITNFPAFTHYSSASSLTPFINSLYTYAIGIATILAVIEIIWGGFLWMGSGASVSNKEAGRSKIMMAIFGLILVLSPYLILSILNPRMLNLKLGSNSVSLNQKDVSTQTFKTSSTQITNGVCDPNSSRSGQFTVPGGCSNTQIASLLKSNGYNLCKDIKKTSNGKELVCLSSSPGSGSATSPISQTLKDRCSKIADNSVSKGNLAYRVLKDFQRKVSSTVDKVYSDGCSGETVGTNFTCSPLPAPPANYVCIYSK